ncbi:hypothetical protein PspS04_18295 [Pseudomonas sp. S04]|nr:hypothetical protein PspS04_18295 [Pseudomonas sp. S04]QHF34675.1 hypothetical protein PspS19_18300 [Pseudomonas sp. S19]
MIDTGPCGSWLASDGGLSFNIDDDCPVAIAGKPAPTGFHCSRPRTLHGLETPHHRCHHRRGQRPLSDG